ncbi:mitochondrial protein [Boletus edulis]|nr:mitochondrial protein [Boletus edulis]
MLVPVARIAGRHFRHSRTLFVSAPSASSSDPWPLPHTPQHLSSTTTPADLPAPEPLPRLNESIETTRARLLYQSRKRGTLESDLLLSTFARDHLPTMIHAELTEYDKGNRTPPERWSDSPILEKLKVHARNEGKVVRKMPPLE